MKKRNIFFSMLIAASLFLTIGCDLTGSNGGGDGGGAAATVINITAIPGVTAPVLGETPVTTITETAQYTGTVSWSPTVSSTFAAETAYTATITLTAKTGYTLTGVSADFFTVAGATSVSNSTDSGVVTAVFPETGAVPPDAIDIAAIPGVTAPVVGETPVTTITETAQYTGTVSWSPTVSSTFAAQTAYTATVTLTAKSGYTFNGVSADFFTVAGATSVVNSADSGVVTVVFPETGDRVIDVAAIPGVTAPAIGATPVSTITETDQYTGTVSWDGGWAWASTFGGAKSYTATITLTAKSGYTLTGVAADFFTVAGATTVTNSAGSGTVTATFPATTTLSVGDATLGGKVAYILQSGDPGYVAGEQRGLIAATADQGTKSWGGNGADLNGTGYTTGTAFGTGRNNTATIVNFFNTIYQSGSPSVTYYTYNWAGLTSGTVNFTDGTNTYAMSYLNGGIVAAKTCADYEVVDGSITYDDWYLPSLDEIDKLYANKAAIDLLDNAYETSSEYDADEAWAVNMSANSQSTPPKSSSYIVRPVRNF